MGKILGFTRRSCSMADKTARDPEALAQATMGLGALSREWPFHSEDKEMYQLRLSMWRRANPRVMFSPSNFGASNSKDVDGIWGKRSFAAIQSWAKFRYGPDVIAFEPGQKGIPSKSVFSQIVADLKRDTPYADVESIAYPYYRDIQGLGKPLLAKLPPAVGPRFMAPSAGAVSGLGTAESLPFDLDTKRADQLRLSLFRRANPHIPFSPADYGADGSREIDGIFGPRSLQATKSYIDARFGPGAISFGPGQAGVSADSVKQEMREALYSDTDYIKNPEISLPYYRAIMGQSHGTLPVLPMASEYRWKLGQSASGQMSSRSEQAQAESADSDATTLTIVGVAAVAAAAAMWFLPRRRR